MDLINRYKNMKKLNRICNENNIGMGNVNNHKISKENKEKLENSIIKEITSIYNYLLFRRDI